MPPTDLIFDDGEPLESNRHRIAMNLLIASVHQAFAGRQDYFTGGNMFVYFSSEQACNRDFKGPDFFVTLDVDGTKERQGWVVWEEGGRYPDAIVELMSPSTVREDTGRKKEIYERVFSTRDYFVYDPFAPDSLRGWHLGGQGYEELSKSDRGWLWCESLGLWLGTWEGTVQQEQAIWWRFFDREGNLVLLPEEVAKLEAQRAESERQRAESERQRAESARLELDALKERLRARGIDPESL
ncbi:Uma2 family endonuclease [Phormidium sp. CCY1219]|uniref:Uma2 family endonuclease n=1 Tax=Phormidium sp. CCY1219 TaxID=2886104 RepID=UPI002D1E5259|nr:Uma2 family endonuclease [Phormidium sp. CCY1219]MEB3827098.1 Uma2 family endonuclease [Phormidium sp. CCY1219]